ncbi:hypothetical protein EHW61_16530 [Salinivibrio sp. VYel6]|uniref:hypothetical protein n=1 Tax=Salinivibrio sp. VYel6 TaxID=2490493 RepID=UPI00128D6F77|nr:hypothetical protein [Salinivibrio sp. VYel6]MPX98233.1 hypothetical protein [Salinivibrio sp. VYel6]
MEFNTQHGKVTLQEAPYLLGMKKQNEMRLAPPNRDGWTVTKTVDKNEVVTQRVAEAFARHAMAYL